MLQSNADYSRVQIAAQSLVVLQIARAVTQKIRFKSSKIERMLPARILRQDG